MTLESLIEAHHPTPEWAVVRELSGMVGSRGVDRRADVVAFNCWPSKGHLRIAYEVKRTRADFMREVDTPKKREWLEQYFHQCYFVVANGIVKEGEVPQRWGLYMATKGGDKLVRLSAAQHREVEALPEWLALSAIRALADGLHQEATRHYNFEGESITRDALDAKVEACLAKRRCDIETEWTEVRRLRQKIADRLKELEAPFAVLAHEAGDYLAFAHREAPGQVTGEDVRRWIARVRLTSIRNVLTQVRGAHTVLGELLTIAQAEGLDAGRETRSSKRSPLG